MTYKSQIALGAVALALAAPAAADAKPTKATVLQVDRGHHALRLVERASSVLSVHYRGRLDRRIRAGSVVSLDAKAHSASRVRFVRRAHQTRFIGRVISSSKNGTVVSLPDGRPFQLGSKKVARMRSQVHGAQNVSLNFEGLQPGQTVMITITYSAGGDINITIALVQEPGNGDSGGSSGPSCPDPNAASGTVTGINRSEGLLTISKRWGDTSTYTVSADALNRLHESDEVLLRLSADDSSVASEVKIVNSKFGTADPNVQEADGTVNSVTPEAGQFAVIQSNHAGRLTLDAPCWILNQVWQSEDVHVIYHRNASGDLVADTVDANDGSEF